MPSRFPNALDGLDNLQTVRDLTTDLSADTINRLRDSILTIEKALGVQINGTYIDLATRIAQFINPDGSLKKEAFQAIGGIFGPIVDDDIDPNARISESKLSLVYPTSLLQDEIKILDARNAGLVDLIINTQSKLQQHITIGTGAHSATAIAVNQQTAVTGSLTATVQIESPNVQAVLQDIYNKHINLFKGTSANLSGGLSITNNAHTADQIFYDNSTSQLSSASVQGAIDSIVTSGNSSINDHQRLLHSNGLLRRIERTDSRNASSIQRGRILLSGVGADTSGVPGIVDAPGSATSQGTSILITVPMTTQPDGSLKNGLPLTFTHADNTVENIVIDVGDDLLLIDPATETAIGVVPITALKIFEPSTSTPLDGYNATGNLIGVEVFYDPTVFSNDILFPVGSVAGSRNISFFIFEHIDTDGNKNGLNMTVRSLTSINESDITSALNEIQIAHPDAATLISKGFNASALARRSDGYFDRNSTNTITFVVDEVTYNINIVPAAPIDITLDTVIAKANLEFYKSNVNLGAYRLGKEIAFAHNWPDDSVIAGADHTIRIVSGAANDASSAAGLGYISNQTVTSSSGNSFVVNGQKRSSLNVKINLAQTGWGFSNTGSGNSNSASTIYFTTINPLLLGVRIGDIVNMQGLTTTGANQDGVRTVSGVTDSSITVNGPPFNTDLSVSSSSTLVVYSNGLLLNNLRSRLQSDYPALITNSDDPTQNIIASVYINANGEVDYRERFIYSGKAALFVPTGGFPGGGGTPPTNLDLISGAIIPGSNGSGIYITDVSRGLEGAATGLRKIISFQFDDQGRVFATFGCPDSTGSFSLSQTLQGPPVNITGDGVYSLVDATGLEFISIHTVKAFQLVSSAVFPTGVHSLTYTMQVYEFEQINEYDNFLIGNVYFNATTNRVPNLNGDTTLVDKRYSGTLGNEQIRDDVVETLFEGPFNETRGDGVVSGLLVPSDQNGSLQIVTDRTVYVNGGVVYIQGIRYEIPSQNLFVDPATLDTSQYGANGFYPSTADQLGYIKYFVIVDQNGRLQTTNKLLLAASTPFVPIAKVIIATAGVGLNQVPIIKSATAVDFRLFIDGIDDKVEITVSPLRQQPAHFHSIAAALEYVDSLRFNDAANSGLNLHTRPMIIRLMDGVYQELTTLNVPPYVTIRGESSRSVRIRPPRTLPGILDVSTVDTRGYNKFIFNMNLLPEGQSNKIENICFDCNLTGPFTGIDAYGNTANRTFAGAININWFSNPTAASALVPTPTPAVPYNTNIANLPSQAEIKGCSFILDGPQPTVGIGTVFGVSVPTIVGGLFRYSTYYSGIFTGVYLSYYGNYFFPTVYLPPVAPTPPVVPTPPTPPSSQPSKPGTPTSPDLSTTGLPATSAFTQGSYNTGGITVLEGNTFVIGDNTTVGIDKFTDTSGTNVPVANARIDAFKTINNHFQYNGTMLSASATTPGPVSGMSLVGSPPKQIGTSIRENIYNLMIHRELRGYDAIQYPNGNLYPDPISSGNGQASGAIGAPSSPNGVDPYYLPPSGRRVTEFMIFEGNTPSGLNAITPKGTRFATDSLDSPARDQHGGGQMFATILVPNDGTPVIVDRSMDWHDRYVHSYINNLLGNSGPIAGVNTSSGITGSPITGNLIYNGVAKQINAGFTVTPANTTIITSTDAYVGSFIETSNSNAAGQVPTGAVSANVSHAYTYGYAAPLSGASSSVFNDFLAGTTISITDWTRIRFLGSFVMPRTTGTPETVATSQNNFALIVMPTGELAVMNIGRQAPSPSSGTNNTIPLQESDQDPGGYESGVAPITGDASRQSSTTGSVPMLLTFVISYSPRLNVLKTIGQSILATSSDPRE